MQEAEEALRAEEAEKAEAEAREKMAVEEWLRGAFRSLEQAFETKFGKSKMFLKS